MWKNKKTMAYRIRPSDVYRIGEHESWFTDMAKNGLHLEKMGVGLAHFRKGTPKAMRYRIDLFPGMEDPLGEHQKDFYRQYGWEYVLRYGNFCVYRSPESENAPELHTDPQEQAYALNRLEKSLRNVTLFIGFMILMIIGMFFGIWKLSDSFVLDLMEGTVLQQVTLVALELYVLLSSLQSWFSLRNLCNELKKGNAINHHATWRKSRYSRYIATFFILLAGGITISIPVLQLTQNTEQTLPVVLETTIPVVRLSEIEQDARLRRAEGQASYGEVDLQNYYRSEWALLARKNYESSEHGLVYEENWKDGSGTYSPSIHSRMLELRFSQLVQPLAEDMIAHYGNPQELAYRNEAFEVWEDDRFDFLSVHTADASIQVCATKDNQVIFLSYYGYVEPEKIINILAEKLKTT